MKAPLPVFLALLGCVAISSPAAEPANDSGTLPSPPMQGKPWTPPETKLPPVVVSAIKELFDQGMADPRGCEYREVEIVSGREYMPSAKVHAWVLPGDGGQRYAVLWNGRVSPVAVVGAAVDLRMDFNATTLGLGQFNLKWGIYNWMSMQEKNAYPIKVAMLLRLGETDLAEGTMKDGGGWKPENGDPYLEMAREWLLGLYSRGTLAHSEGNDGLALQIFRALPPLEKSAEETAIRRGFSKQSAAIPEMRDLPLLATDQERRAKEPPHNPAPDAGIADQHERIATLIRDLELVYSVPPDYKMQTDVSADADVRALVREGDAAVEPLIDCFENDRRLTRTQFTPGWLRDQPPQPWIPVSEPAYVALTAILRASIAIPLPEGKTAHDLTMEDRKALAAKFREYWTAHKNMSPAERWFATLRNDNAAPAEWLLAAEIITQPVSEISTGKGAAPMRGESLRNRPGRIHYLIFGILMIASGITGYVRKRSVASLLAGGICGAFLLGATYYIPNPSVNDLLTRRFGQMLALAKKDPAVNRASMGNFLFALADWNGDAHIDGLREMTGQFNKAFGYWDYNSTEISQINATLYQKRFAAGDPAALAEYAGWLSTLKPENTSPLVFQLMWEHPGDPAIRIAAEKLFGAMGSPWRLGRYNSFTWLFNTPMLGITPFRAQVLAALDNTTVMGYARRLPNDANIHIYSEPPENPQSGATSKMDFRVCDFYANKFSAVRTFPDCQLDWPQEKRDAAVAGCKILIANYGQGGASMPGSKTGTSQNAQN